MAWISTTRAHRRLASIAVIVLIFASMLAAVTANDGGESNQHLRSPSVISQRQYHQQRQLQQNADYATEHKVTMVFSLHYLNDETATLLEIPDPTNELVLHFCESVNKRASSRQVDVAASGFGAAVETQVINATVTDGVPDYQCSITATNRDYDNDGEDVFGQGFFILEVEVNQIVYVTTNSGDVLADPIVRDIVESGFNRGEGGRVRFRALLQQNARFSTVLNIEVLEKLSSPKAAPTPKPTPSPSQRPTPKPTPTPSQPPTTTPTFHPSKQPSAAPTLSPSEAPSTNAPTVLVRTPTPSSEAATTVPTTLVQTPTPSRVPSSAQSVPPSSSPSLRPSEAPVASQPPVPPSSYNRRALVLGAIAGGVVTIIISLFFIFCVWFPLCGRNKDEDDIVTAEDDPGNRRCHPSTSTRMSPSRLLGLEDPAIVPGVVQFDSENESLADTTLDSRKPGGKKRDPRMFDSFDENSVYTEGMSNDNKEAGRAAASMVLPPSLSRALEYEEDIVFEASGSATDSSAGADVGSSTKVVGIMDSSDGQAFKELDELVARSKEASPSSSFPGTETVRSDENRAKEIARSINAGTKGFDPFNEDTSGSSSFEFDSDVATEEPWRPEPYSADDDQSAPSSSSSQTERIKNLLLPSPGNTERLISPTEEEKREVDDEIRDDPESIDFYPPPSPPLDQRDANNDLLRNMLEDARRSMSTSAQSRLSRKSAPSRVLEKKARPRRDVDPPQDLLADHQDLEEHMTILNSRASRRKVSSKSVGAPSRSSTREGNPAHPFSGTEAMLLTTGTDPHHGTQAGGSSNTGPQIFVPPKPRNEARNKNAAGQTAVAFRTSTPKIEKTMSHPVTPMTSPSGKLGAQPRGHNYDGGQKLPETPGSSPGVLGITVPPKGEGAQAMSQTPGDASSESDGSGMSNNPWLFHEVEQTLGPLSPSADMESISGRSNRSAKSLKSSRSAKSRQSHRSHHSYNSYGSASTERQGHRYDLYSRSSTGQQPIIDGSLGEHKSNSDKPMAPRTLEYDLKRLEVQLGMNHQPSDQTTTSSITASSAGASRSTLSSKPPASKRVTVRRSKKKRVVLVVPPGKLGVVLADRHDGKGTVVSEVRASSTINGMLSPGDKLVAIDGKDCTSMLVGDITTLMASRAHKERRLTVLTSSSIADVQEAKYETDDLFS